MGTSLYTIGYSAFDRDQMISILKELKIDCLIDVRSVPASAHAPEFNKDVFSQVLQQNKLYYRNYLEFGARQTNTRYFSQSKNGDLYLDFDKYILSDQFRAGMTKVKKGIELNYKFVFMCAEKDPINCHRALMVAKAFSKEEYQVEHIIVAKDKNFALEDHKKLEERLVEVNDEDLNQGDLLSSFEEAKENKIAAAYRAANEKIGYRLTSKDMEYD